MNQQTFSDRCASELDASNIKKNTNKRKKKTPKNTIAKRTDGRTNQQTFSERFASELDASIKKTTTTTKKKKQQKKQQKKTTTKTNKQTSPYQTKDRRTDEPTNKLEGCGWPDEALNVN